MAPVAPPVPKPMDENVIQVSNIHDEQRKLSTDTEVHRLGACSKI